MFKNADAYFNMYEHQLLKVHENLIAEVRKGSILALKLKDCVATQPRDEVSNQATHSAC